MSRKNLVITVAIAALFLAIGAVVILDEEDKADFTGSRFPTQASAVYPDGSSDTTFKNAGEMVATAAFVVEGKVLRVEQGETVRLSDGSGDEIVPRILVVQVHRLFYSRSPDSKAPSTLQVTDGYWQDGVGYERESIGWAAPGQIGFFLLSRDRAPDGTELSTYSPLNGRGIALVDRGQVKYAADGVWRSLGDSATPAEFGNALDQGADAAESGAAAPVPITICYPSIPGDEDSEPICEEE